MKSFGFYPKDNQGLRKGLRRGCDAAAFLFRISFWLLCGEWPGMSLRDSSSGQDSKGWGSVPGGRDRNEATDQRGFQAELPSFGATGGGAQGGFLGFSGWTETCRDQVRWFLVLFSEPPLLGTCFHLVLLFLFLLRNHAG